MKKALLIILATVMMLALCSCGQNNTNVVVKEQNESEQSISTNSESSNSQSQQISTTFEYSKDLSVVSAFVYDRDTYVLVENTGTQPILNFEIAYLNFDKNGFLTTTDSDGYESGKYEAANLMPGAKDIPSWYGADGNYALAVVTKIDYADGTTWKASHVDKWAESAKKEFSVEKYKSELDKLKNIANKAESNEYIALTDFSIKHGNQFADKHDLHFSVTNTSNQGVASINLFVLEFDNNGFPVSVSPYDVCCLNGHTTGGQVNLAAGQSDELYDDLFISPATTKLKTIIANIVFQDGTEWVNPYLFEWIIANNASY